jgi:hypothetical protein
MGYEFTLTLNRKITDEEIAALLEAGCAGASISTVPYPTGADPDLIVTQLDFDDTESENLEVAITVALEAVKAVPDLSVATFSAPAQPNGLPPDEEDEWYKEDAPPASAAAIESSADDATPAAGASQDAAAADGSAESPAIAESPAEDAQPVS